MGLPDEIVQVDALERQLLADLSSSDYNGTCEDEILYDASFGAMEDSFVKYHIARWILMSTLLILAWGLGLLMLLYLPIWIYVCRRDFRSRKLYLTPHAIVYKVTKPFTFPCFGVLKNEKHVILPSVSDIVVEQGKPDVMLNILVSDLVTIVLLLGPGDERNRVFFSFIFLGYLQSFFGVYSIRIENIGVQRPVSDDIKIIGVAHPHDFRKAVLIHLLNTRNQNFSRKASVVDDHKCTSSHPITSASVHPLGDLIVAKLDEVEISVKKMQARLQGAETSKMKTTSS